MVRWVEAATCGEKVGTTDQAISRYDFDQAKIHLQYCLATWPRWPDRGEVHFLLARTCRRAEDFEGAYRHLQEAERLQWSAKDIELEYLLLQVQQSPARGQTARFLSQQLDARVPEEVLILEALVRGLLWGKRLGEARFWLDHWQKHYPDDWRASLWRGALFEYIGDYGRAASDYQRVLELKSDHAEARRRLSFVLLNTGFYREALQHYERYLQDHPHDPEALVGLARCQRQLGQTAAARAIMKQWLALGKEDVDAFLTLAQLELAEGSPDYEQALHWLRRAERLPPATVDQVLTRVQLLVQVLRRLGYEAEAKAEEARAEELQKELIELSKALREVAGGSQDVTLRRKIGTTFMRIGMEQAGQSWLRN